MTPIQNLLLLPRRERESPEIVAEIRHLVKTDPDSRRYYVQWMAFETNLQWQIAGHPEVSNHIALQFQQNRRLGVIRRLAATVALTCLISVGMWFWAWTLNKQVNDIPLAQLAGHYTSSTRTSWAGDRYKQRSVVRYGERLQLLSGSFLLHMDSGATVSCVAPVDLQILNPWEVRVHSGKACVYVPERAHGFRVSTHAMRVIDLGTLFGIAVDGASRASVHVFEGEVTGQAMEATPVSITAGLSRSAGVGEYLSDVEPASTAMFGELLTCLNGVVELKGDVQFLPLPPTSVKAGDLAGPGASFLFLETRQHTLQAPLTVYESLPGNYDSEHLPSPMTLPAETRITSYLLHCNNTEKNRSSRATIEFQSPVLGFLFDSGELDDTDPILGDSRTSYPEKGTEPKRGTFSNEAGDLIEISADRKTISFEIANVRTAYDQFRILFHAPPE